MKDQHSSQMKSYLQDIENGGFDRILTTEQEQKLSKIILKSKNEVKKDEAINELVVHNLRLVIKIATKFHGQVKFCRGVSFEDLISVGNMGLMRAAKRFDASYA